jgi:hypothetical protein
MEKEYPWYITIDGKEDLLQGDFIEECPVILLPPYREHLSQAFARFFMRVGLPVDIPPF